MQTAVAAGSGLNNRAPTINFADLIPANTGPMPA
jgi:hypothetical protein